MNISYNIDEVFELAEQIERNGGIFYRKAAEIIKPESTRNLLLSLAKQEDEHEKLFADMRKHIVKNDNAITSYDSDEIVVKYLKAVAGNYVFNKKQMSKDTLRGNESISNILNMAIAKEKDSIILYLGIKGVMTDKEESEKIDFIIKEEQKHFAELTDVLRTI